MEVAGTERGPLPSIGSATSSVSSSSLTTLMSQGYLTVPIKDAGVKPLKSTSYYLVDLTDASPEILEIMDHDMDVVKCLEDEVWMKKTCTEWLFDEGMIAKYHFAGMHTTWVRDKAGITSNYRFNDSYLFETSNEGGMEDLMDIDGGPKGSGPGYPRSHDFGHDSGPATSSSRGLMSGSDLNDSSLFTIENQEERQDQTQQLT